MITLRCTQKLLAYLGEKPARDNREPTSPLGDWYANPVVVSEDKCVVLVTNEKTLVSVLLSLSLTADLLAEFRKRVPTLLRRLDIPKVEVERESFQIRSIDIGRTQNRRVLGAMNEIALQVGFLSRAEPPSTTKQIEDAIADLLCSVNSYRRPREVLQSLLLAPGKGSSVASEPKARSSSKKHQHPRQGELIEIALTHEERKTLVEHTLAGGSLIRPLRSKEPVVRYTPGGLDELLGYVAAEANHSSLGIQRKLDALYDKLQAALDDHDGADGIPIENAEETERST